MKQLRLHHLPPAAVITVIANALGLIVLAFLGMGWYERQQYEREHETPYLTYLNSPFPTLESAVSVDHVVRYIVRRRNRDSEAHIYPIVCWLVSDTDPNQPPIMLASAMAPVEPGETEWVSGINRIPLNTPIGTYHIEGMTDIPGIYRTFNLRWSSQAFHVIGPSY